MSLRKTGGKRGWLKICHHLKKKNGYIIWAFGAYSVKIDFATIKNMNLMVAKLVYDHFVTPCEMHLVKYAS